MTADPELESASSTRHQRSSARMIHRSSCGLVPLSGLSQWRHRLCQMLLLRVLRASMNQAVDLPKKLHQQAEQLKSVEGQDGPVVITRIGALQMPARQDLNLIQLCMSSELGLAGPPAPMPSMQPYPCKVSIL